MFRFTEADQPKGTSAMTLRFDANGSPEMVPGTPATEWAFDLAAHEYKAARVAFGKKKTKANLLRFNNASDAFDAALEASKIERDQIARNIRLIRAREYLAVRAALASRQSAFAF